MKFKLILFAFILGLIAIVSPLLAQTPNIVIPTPDYTNPQWMWDNADLLKTAVAILGTYLSYLIPGLRNVDWFNGPLRLIASGLLVVLVVAVFYKLPIWGDVLKYVFGMVGPLFLKGTVIYEFILKLLGLSSAKVQTKVLPVTGIQG